MHGNGSCTQTHTHTEHRAFVVESVHSKGYVMELHLHLHLRRKMGMHVCMHARERTPAVLGPLALPIGAVAYATLPQSS
uniref:Predicted protein n=1 Tax=Hordeum vulgare subsp. vulgare TaxID=112509 RepID=F2CTC5_HORVV|nr:predicted protein [Hordeum vulgare subsp. vulgare]BAJ98334.1 predicted protein [Hordeum vulgare subsp. vulgare]